MSAQVTPQYDEDYDVIDEASRRFKPKPLPPSITSATDEQLKEHYEKALFLCPELRDVDTLIRRLLHDGKPSRPEALHSWLKATARIFVGDTRGIANGDEREWFPSLTTTKPYHQQPQRPRPNHGPVEAYLRRDSTYAAVAEVWDRMIGL